MVWRPAMLAALALVVALSEARADVRDREGVALRNTAAVNQVVENRTGNVITPSPYFDRESINRGFFPESNSVNTRRTNVVAPAPGGVANNGVAPAAGAAGSAANGGEQSATAAPNTQALANQYPLGAPNLSQESAIKIQERVLSGSKIFDSLAIKDRLNVPSYKAPVFVGSDPSLHILPPDQDPGVRINPEAPGPFIGMAIANQAGDKQLAQAYAGSFVRYQLNLFFEVKQLTELIGQALIDQKVIADDDWDGMSQFIDYNYASARKENGELFKPTHERAMEQVKPDPKNQVEIYYFFSMNCSWCRKMAPDVERVWQVAKNDKSIRMVGLVPGKIPQKWLEEYREYTGLTLPIYEGAAQAKAFRVKYMPALVVVTPNSKQAYLKTGEQSFARMYEFIKKAQGLPASMTAEVERLTNTRIGQVENALPPSRANYAAADTRKVLPVRMVNESQRPSMEKF